MELVVARPEGLYCPPGDFYIDPWRPVTHAIITHAHSDHARYGSRRYLSTPGSEQVLRARLGEIRLQTLPYGERLRVGDATVSLHPAGHILGSAQLRIEHRGEVWVASGDYKTEADATCAPFEPVRCHTFITESTFGLPIYRWVPQAEIFADINGWWAGNAELRRPSVLFCYSLGKAQRILKGLDPGIGPIAVHGALEAGNEAYRVAGVALPHTLAATTTDPQTLRSAMVLAPPSARGSTWMRRFGQHADAFASGWMQLRGARRRRGVDRGFVLSDHADWPGLLDAIRGTGAQQVFVTHGSTGPMQRWLSESGLQARTFHTEYGDEDEAVPPAPAASAGDRPA